MGFIYRIEDGEARDFVAFSATADVPDGFIYAEGKIPNPFTLWSEEAKEQRALKLLREKRNEKLKLTDFECLSDRTPTDEILNYRQALRDLTTTATPQLTEDGELDENSFSWPTMP